MNQGMTFWNSKIIYYGPFNCELCGTPICRMGQEFGHNAFSYPDGPIYPNTEWHVHVCDPRSVLRERAHRAELKVLEKHPTAQAVFSKEQGWMIVANDSTLNLACAWPNQSSVSYCQDSASAWMAAKAIAFPDEGQEA